MISFPWFVVKNNLIVKFELLMRLKGQTKCDFSEIEGSYSSEFKLNDVLCEKNVPF